MNCAEFIQKAERRGIKLSVADDNLAYDAPEGAMTDDVLSYVRQRKPEIIEELSKQMPASKLAVLMSLPDGFRFWLAPDDMEFDAGDIPILRRSVMDELAASGADVKTELHSIIQSMRELGGELRVTGNSEGVQVLPDTQKCVTGDCARPLHG